MSREITVFVSHSHRDIEIAEKMCEYLHQKGLTCWISSRNIPGGKWPDYVMHGINNCDVFVLIYSKYSNESRNVEDEVVNAAETDALLIPFCLDSSEMNASLKLHLTKYEKVMVGDAPPEQKFDELYQKITGAMDNGNFSLNRSDEPESRQPAAVHGMDANYPYNADNIVSVNHSGRRKPHILAISIVVLAFAIFAAYAMLSNRSSDNKDFDDSETVATEEITGETAEDEVEEEIAEETDSAEELAEETIEEEIVAIGTEDSEAEQDEQEADETLDESEDADLSEAEAVLISEDGYILKAEAISEETIEQLQAQVEDSFYAYVAEEWDRETMTLRGMDYLGYYFLAEKYSSDPQNMIYLVYKVTLEYYVETNPLISDELITYYYYVGFSDLLVLYNGLISLDYSKTYETENTFSENDFTYYGYQELEDLYIDVVTVHMGSYSYESTVEDQDFGYEISILSYGPDEDDFEYNGHYYRVFETQMSWADAETFCEELGGHLVTITSQEENDAVMDLLSDHTTGSYIIGLYRDTDEFEIWVTGEKLEYTNWGDGEPDNLSGDQRLGVIANEILTGSGYSISYGEWDDLGDLGCYFICEWDGVTGEEAEVSDPVEMQIPTDALVYNGHSYYLFDDVCDSWVEAKEYCESLGGHLAYIKDSETDKTLYSYIRMLGYKSAFFGLRYSVVHGWIWDDGTTLSYENWAVDEPSGDGVYGMYYEEFTDGGWNDGTFGFDADCFICEWDGV